MTCFMMKYEKHSTVGHQWRTSTTKFSAVAKTTSLGGWAGKKGALQKVLVIGWSPFKWDFVTGGP